jgi:hypothetical protein
LRAIPDTVAKKEPELEVELLNTSKETVHVPIHRALIDSVTFILRGPDDEVLSSFCYITVHSNSHSHPPVPLKPGEPLRCRVYLSVAADHGFQALRPGMYSLEAVFQGRSLGDDPLPRMCARSNRLPVRVGKR